MSIQAISAAIKLRGVSSSEKLMLIALANYANASGRCWPSQRLLAEDTGFTDRTVRNVLAALEVKGLISRTARHHRSRGRMSDLFTLNVPDQQTSHVQADWTSRNDVPEALENVSDGEGGELPGGPVVASGLTTFEPSIQPSSEPLGDKAPALTGRRVNLGRRVPVNWSPSAKAMDQLVAEGFSPGELERALTRMRDHEFRTAKSDWDSTYRNWVRREADFNPRRGHDQHLLPAPLAAGKRLAREANYGRALAGAYAAAGKGSHSS